MTTPFQDMIARSGFFSDYALDLIKGESSLTSKILSISSIKDIKEDLAEDVIKDMGTENDSGEIPELLEDEKIASIAISPNEDKLVA